MRPLIRAVLFAAAAICCLHAQSGKGLISDRLERVSRSERKQEEQQTARVAPWSSQKILANLEARTPVIAVLGYFSAFGDNAEKLQKLRERVQPVAAKIALISQQHSFFGTEFPDDLTKQLEGLRALLFKAVEDIYGPDARKEVEAYALTAKPQAFVP